ncbi:MAG: PAS domain S-box protein [Pseudomonadota bacterium]
MAASRKERAPPGDKVRASYTGPSITELQRRTAMLEALASAAAQMIGDSWEDGIQSLLAKLGTSTGVSRVTLFKAYQHPTLGWVESCCYDWAEPGLETLSADPRYQEIPLKDEETGQALDDWSRRRMAGEVIQANLEDTSGDTRRIFEEHGTLSFVSVPILVGDDWWGFLGFDDCVAPRSWTDSEIHVLKTAAILISGAISRTRTEERLRISEERYALAARGANDGQWDWDLASDTSYFSPRLHEILGLEEGQLESTPDAFFSQLAHDDADALRAILANRFQRHRPKFECECRLANEAEGARWVTLRGLVLYDEKRPVRIVVSIHDSTIRKLAEEHVRESEERFRAIVEAVPIPIAISRVEDGSLILVNGPCAQVFALPRDDLEGRRTAAFYADPSQRERILRRLEQRGSVQNAELQLKRGDGRDFWALMSIRPLSYHGEPAYLSAIIDISDFKHSEAALRDSEVLKSAIIENALGAIVAINRGGQIVEFNPVAEQCFGYDRTEVLGSQMAELLIPPHLRAAHYRGFESYLQSGEGPMLGQRVELTGLRADGSEFPIEITISRAVVGDSEMFVSFIVDLTEKKASEAEIARQREALHQSEKLAALGTLLAGVAHELNNPLAIVVGRAFMLSSSATDENVVSSAEKIRQAAERCARIVKTFLAMARHRPPEHQPIQVNEMVGEVLELLDYGLRSNDVELDYKPAEALPELWADPDQLGQVVMNLVVNAQHALIEVSGRRRLTIRTRTLTARREIEITVADNGPGVPAEIRSRIFDPFYTTKPSGSGTGVGLSVSLAAVRAHNGVLSLQQTPGGGATFVVTLPLGEGAAAGGTIQDDTPGVRPCRLLVVDDEPEIAQVLVDILEADGHVTAIAESGRQALRLINESSFDLILSDLRMPDLDGMGLYKELKTMDPGLTERLVFVTGDTLSAGIESFLDAAGCPTIEKPFAPEEVLKTVRDRLACAKVN